MAHSLSAKKRIRQNVTQRARNRARRSLLKTHIKEFSESLVSGNAATAETKFRETCQLLDREANRGLIHKNTAARMRSRLALKMNGMKQKAVG